MPDRQLHNLVLPSDAQLRSKSERRQRLQQAGLLQSDSPAIEQLSIEPGDRILEGSLRGKHAQKLASEFEELFGASGYQSVAFFDPNQPSQEDGYYALQDATIGPIDPRQDYVYRVDGSVLKEGTRRTHFRSINYTITQLDHPFGNDTTAYIGVPGQGDVRGWFDPQSSTLSDATIVETGSGEFADVDVYDADAAPSEASELVYSLPYDREWQSACRGWDTRGHESKLADGVPQWGRVFRTDHEYLGLPVVENGLVRLEIDETGNTLSVSTWDIGSSRYTSVSLGTSDWELYEWDTRTISPSRLEAVTEWRDPTQSPTAYYSLKAILDCGYQDILFDRGVEDTGTPPGLVDLLEPIAASSFKDPGVVQGLRKRSEVKS